MTIRTFQSGDEAGQVSIYNEACAHLPRFKPATLDEVRRRCRAPDFNPPTPAARQGNPYSPVRPDDIPALANLAPEVLRTTAPAELDRHFFHNPYFAADALFALRNRQDGALEAVGLIIMNPAYANPKQID